MKIAILSSKGSFSDRWIAYCEDNGINYKLVDPYRTDIIQQLKDCEAIMWHFNHKGPKESKFAKQLLLAIQASGKRVFPDCSTVWHFDDKIAQKYLLEVIGAPLAPAYVFYSKKEAIEWANRTSYPKVFKLRNGAGSDNVSLVKTKNKASRLIKKAFSNGFKQYKGWSNLKERYRKYRLGKTNFWDLFKGFIRLAHTTEYARLVGRESGYIYFQDYIPDNDHDIRVIVVGDKAFAIKRIVRENDFRASGSGNILYDRHLFDENLIRLSFDISKKLVTQCVAFDYVHDKGNPLLVEISYGFSPEGYDPCTGYWDKDLIWYEGKFDPYGWMIEDLLKSVERRVVSSE
jgi:glutathione synthase/RimK-type ligase-like ATP-grasp enzyme